MNAWGERYTGFVNALKDSGLEADEDLCYFKNLTVKTGYQAIQRFTENNKSFDGIVCASDEIAMGAINALREKGIKVPEDVSVIGFDNNVMGSIFYPKLTTISQPSYDMGSVAVRMLIKMLNKKELDNPNYVLNYELIKRESTK